MRNFLLSSKFLYFGALFCIYPIVAHIIMYELNFLTEKLPHGEFWISIQVFVSGPLLILIGCILFRRSTKVNIAVGLLCFLIGLAWLAVLVKSVIDIAP